MNKKIIVFAVVLILIVITLLVITLNKKTGETGSVVKNNVEVTFYHSPTCGCCDNYEDYLESKGFELKEIESDLKLKEIKQSLHIPTNMQSCHTAIIGKYFIEGHMPVEAIEKLLREQPDIDGIALPGMPSGSPGMPGMKQGEWIVYAVKGNNISEFMKL